MFSRKVTNPIISTNNPIPRITQLRVVLRGCGFISARAKPARNMQNAAFVAIMKVSCCGTIKVTPEPPDQVPRAYQGC